MSAAQNECIQTDHVWHFIKDENDVEWVITDLCRHGMFKSVRDRLFGPLNPKHLGFYGSMDRGVAWHKGTKRKWACAKCRKIVWDYEPTGTPKPEVNR